MRAELLGKRMRFLLPTFVCALLIVGAPILTDNVHSQSNKLVLISEETSTRAVAVDSVTQKHEPFSTRSTVPWGSDSRTRIMLFVMGLNLQPGEAVSAITADAEDGAHNIHHLAVEYVGPVPEQDWISSIVLRLNDQMADVGDVLIGISYQGRRHVLTCIGIGAVATLALLGLLAVNRSRPSPKSAVLFHFVIFCWLASYTFPYLGELP